MEIIQGIDALKGHGRICVTVGVFDGLHRGHLRVLARLVEVSARLGATPTVITFDPHPEAVVKGRAPDLIMDPVERLERLAAAGVGITVVQRFDEAFRRTSARAFLERMGAGDELAGLVMTAESAFGRDRAGTLVTVSEMSVEAGFEVVEAPRYELGGAPVSSSRIRSLIESGRLAAARDLLGHRYALVGDVVHGDARGRELGFPTANIAFGDPVCLPPDGVYVARIGWGGETLLAPGEVADAVVSLGTQPTFGGRVRLLEAFLLDRSEDLYGARMRVEVIRRLRGQRRFTSVEALIAEMDRDVTRARALVTKDAPA
jgi:riboflavin kinase/FMN adenylyltransferase